jgi:glycosyltransferase involved in cell wall biosynthesis
VDLLLDAWQKAEAVTENCQLLIAGTGPSELLEQIREQVDRLELKRVDLHLKFISTQELVAVYRAADVVVYPYRAITTSGAMATGLAMGKTIVASDLPVFRELLVNRESALLVDPHNSEQLSNALTQLVMDGGLRAALANRVRALNFGDQSWLTIGKQTEQVYAAVIP